MASAGAPPDGRVKVAVRIRPLSEKERLEGCSDAVVVHPESNIIEMQEWVEGGARGRKRAARQYGFDNVFAPNSTQQEIYDQIGKPICTDFLRGYNATLLAYGQTGSGKTHSMGTAFDAGSTDGDFASGALAEHLGLVPRLVADILSRKDELLSSSYGQEDSTAGGSAGGADGDAAMSATAPSVPLHRLTVTYEEIYCEVVRDLLSPLPPVPVEKLTRSDTLRLREDAFGNVVAEGSVSRELTSVSDLADLLRDGAERRATGSTSMNEHSSRSHAILTLRLDVFAPGSTLSDRPLRVSLLRLVDLAGSERLKQTGAEGQRAKEGNNINLSLMTLSRCIMALAERSSAAPGAATARPPFRDSALTRMLTNSLGGNSATVLLACASPADVNAEQTSTTLGYASSAAKICNRLSLQVDTAAMTSMALRADLAIATAELARLYGAGAPVSDSVLERFRLAMHGSSSSAAPAITASVSAATSAAPPAPAARGKLSKATSAAGGASSVSDAEVQRLRAELNESRAALEGARGAELRMRDEFARLLGSVRTLHSQYESLQSVHGELQERYSKVAADRAVWRQCLEDVTAAVNNGGASSSSESAGAGAGAGAGGSDVWATVKGIIDGATASVSGSVTAELASEVVSLQSQLEEQRVQLSVLATAARLSEEQGSASTPSATEATTADADGTQPASSKRRRTAGRSDAGVSGEEGGAAASSVLDNSALLPSEAEILAALTADADNMRALQTEANEIASALRACESKEESLAAEYARLCGVAASSSAQSVGTSFRRLHVQDMAEHHRAVLGEADAAAAAIDRLATELSQKEHEMTRLQHELESLRSAPHEAGISKKALAARDANLLAQIEKLQQEIARLEVERNKLAKAAEEAKARAAEIQRLRNELERSNSAKVKLTRSLAEAQAKMRATELSAKASRAASDRAAVEARRAQEELVAQVKRMEAQIRALRAQADAKKAKEEYAESKAAVSAAQRAASRQARTSVGVAPVATKLDSKASSAATAEAADSSDAAASAEAAIEPDAAVAGTFLGNALNHIRSLLFNSEDGEMIAAATAAGPAASQSLSASSTAFAVQGADVLGGIVDVPLGSGVQPAGGLPASAARLAGARRAAAVIARVAELRTNRLLLTEIKAQTIEERKAAAEKQRQFEAAGQRAEAETQARAVARLSARLADITADIRSIDEAAHREDVAGNRWVARVLRGNAPLNTEASGFLVSAWTAEESGSSGVKTRARGKAKGASNPDPFSLRSNWVSHVQPSALLVWLLRIVVRLAAQRKLAEAALVARDGTIVPSSNAAVGIGRSLEAAEQDQAAAVPDSAFAAVDLDGLEAAAEVAGGEASYLPPDAGIADDAPLAARLSTSSSSMDIIAALSATAASTESLASAMVDAEPVATASSSSSSSSSGRESVAPAAQAAKRGAVRRGSGSSDVQSSRPVLADDEDFSEVKPEARRGAGRESSASVSLSRGLSGRVSVYSKKLSLQPSSATLAATATLAAASAVAPPALPRQSIIVKGLKPVNKYEGERPAFGSGTTRFELSHAEASARRHERIEEEWGRAVTGDEGGDAPVATAAVAPAAPAPAPAPVPAAPADMGQENAPVPSTKSTRSNAAPLGALPVTAPLAPQAGVKRKRGALGPAADDPENAGAATQAAPAQLSKTRSFVTAGGGL